MRNTYEALEWKILENGTIGRPTRGKYKNKINFRKTGCDVDGTKMYQIRVPGKGFGLKKTIIKT
jgi:hypothetical protein